MSTGTEHQVHGKLDEITGKLKQTFGEATGNDKLANEGTAQQVKGHVEQAYGSVKGAAEEKVADLKARHEAEQTHTHVEHESRAHDIREKIISTAQNVRDHIQQDVDGDRISN
jgi:uncharacterized protein YjbJ (UPF0337 family)